MIDEFRFGKIIINGKIYHKDVIIFPDRIIPDWKRDQGHSLIMDDLKDVIAVRPRVLVIGTGVYGRVKIPKETLTALQAAKIEVIAEKTKVACQIFNQRKAEGNIVAALHLTC